MLKVKSITKESLMKIESRLPELYRAKSKIGKSHSQASYTLQTLNMLDDSPMSRMKQCISQIEHKYQAIKEAFFKVEKMKLEIKNLEKTKGKTESYELSNLKIWEYQTQINTLQYSMENSLREIGMFQDFYDSIRLSNGISENWTEADFEKQEISNMVKRSIRLGIQNISATGRVSAAAVEFWEQLGIHPQAAEKEIRLYLDEINNLIIKDQPITIKKMYEFLDYCEVLFKDSYKYALARIGLNEIGSSEFTL